MRDDEEHGLSRRTDPHTSHLAGERVNVNQLEWEALEGLASGPRTSTEVAEFHAKPRDWYSPRMRPLIKKGLVYQHGVKPCRSATGRHMQMITWALTPKGRGLLGLAPEPPPALSSSPAAAAAQTHQDEFEFWSNDRPSKRNDR